MQASRNATNAPTPAAWEADGLRLHVLASGSQGNCCVLETPRALVLVDAGISTRQITVRMRALGLDPTRVQALLVTHEHSDHIGGLRVAAKTFGVPVYASRGTSSSDKWRAQGDLDAHVLTPRESLDVAGVRVLPFLVPHDAAETLGFRFERAGDSVGYCTDLGTLTDEAATHLADVGILAIESNHDRTMLRDYTGYPAYLKARIGGASGHLSNEQATQAVALLATSTTRAVVGMHVSQHTNLPSLARAALTTGKERCPATGTAVCVASQAVPFSCL